MTELEKIVYTKSFIDKLAIGINPLDGTSIPETDIMNNVRLVRCMFYVSDILRQVIEQGGITPQKTSKTPSQAFYLSAEQRCSYEYSSAPIPISEITKRINALIDDTVMKKLAHRAITTWLINGGFLYEEEQSNGKLAKRPTSSGEIMGITKEIRNGMNGPYTVVVYNCAAQQFILDNLDSIIEFEKEMKRKQKPHQDK